MEPLFDALHPDVGQWCRDHLKEATEPQRAAIPLGLQRRNMLICSPTGTGKTLAAFLPVISALARRRDEDRLYPRTFALYVSPLRALGYDVEHNVRAPLREMGLLERPNSPRARLRRGNNWRWRLPGDLAKGHREGEDRSKGIEGGCTETPGSG